MGAARFSGKDSSPPVRKTSLPPNAANSSKAALAVSTGKRRASALGEDWAQQ